MKKPVLPAPRDTAQSMLVKHSEMIFNRDNSADQAHRIVSGTVNY
jgi:hypothetical protein